MTDDDHRLARLIAVEASIGAITSRLRDTLKPDLFRAIYEDAVAAAQANAPDHLANEAGNSIGLRCFVRPPKGHS